MTKAMLLVAVVVSLLSTACSDDTVAPKSESFTAALNGANERPTSNASTGAGTATFRLSANRDTLSWTVSMTGTNNVIASHIHIGGKEVAGPIVMNLYGAAASANPSITGSVSRATYSSPLGVSFDALISLMRSGDTYANVHTDNGVAPANTGPGDLASGEIRGQIAPAGSI